MSLFRSTTKSVQAGFSTNVLKRATGILLGNISTTWYVDQIASRVPAIRSNPVFEVGSLLLLGSLNAVVAAKIWPKHASDVLIGGILAGVTRAVKTVLPGHFATCGLGDDMDGLGAYYASPGNFVITPNGQFVNHLNGLGAYPSPQAPLTGTHGLGDEAMFHQVQPTNVIQLDGMADSEVGREIAMQM